jgi:PPK2 family polyphosphate:nucleotide phosphotransferase
VFLVFTAYFLQIPIEHKESRRMNSADYRVPPSMRVKLDAWDPDDQADLPDKLMGRTILKENRKRIIDLQEKLYAENGQSLLVVFQAMDTGGKDGCIENVFKGVNPAGCRVDSFKVPTSTELSHDFLWRYHQEAPARGFIEVFNRSHYEDVLVVRVKNLVPEDVWSNRYDQINGFERLLESAGTRIVKFYLHISKDEQKKRLQARLDDPEKHWKFSTGDLADRALWDEYQTAFEVALGNTSTETAPWYVVPANRKWFRDVVVSTVIRETLEDMNPQFLASAEDLSGITIAD